MYTQSNAISRLRALQAAARARAVRARSLGIAGGGVGPPAMPVEPGGGGTHFLRPTKSMNARGTYITAGARATLAENLASVYETILDSEARTENMSPESAALRNRTDFLRLEQYAKAHNVWPSALQVPSAPAAAQEAAQPAQPGYPAYPEQVIPELPLPIDDTKVGWKTKYKEGEAPTYWKGLVPKEWTPGTEYAAIANALLPSLSPEDQRTVSAMLATSLPKGFAGYSLEKNQGFVPPADVSSETAQHYNSAARAQEVLSILDLFQKASKRSAKNFGPGYRYLRNLAASMRDFGGTPSSGMTHAQARALLGALDPLLATSKGGDLGAYSSLARALTQPFFSAGQVLPVAQGEGGYIFGKSNQGLY